MHVRARGAGRSGLARPDRNPLRRGWLFPLLLSLCAPLFAQNVENAPGLQPIPPLQARVTDLTGTLDDSQRASLEQKLQAFETRKGAQVAVLVVPTTEPEAIEQYSIRVVEQWKLGRREVNGQRVDDGALLLVAKNDRRMRIEVGYGLEGVLTDATSARIISESMSPLFRQGDFFGGINAGLDQMIRVIDGEQLPEPDHKWKGGTQPIAGALPFLFFAAVIGATVLRRLFGRGVGTIATAGLTGFLAWVLTHILPLALFAGAIGFVFALFTGAFGGGWSNGVSGGGRSRRYRGGGWGGGWGGGGFGGGGFGGGGGGGFSGGGGSFGGGGASGSW
jgi:uncharacterized protein